MAGRVVLEILNGPQSGRRWEFDEHDLFVFGRATDCHARMPSDDLEISRHHFVLEVNPPSARIRDLGSRNRTFVNDVATGGREAGESPEEGAKRAHESVGLRDDDRIRAGTTEIGVHIVPPVFCPDCGSELDPEAAGEQICTACRERGSSDVAPETLATRASDPRCRQCGRNMDTASDGGGLCDDCRETRSQGSTDRLRDELQAAINEHMAPLIPDLVLGRMLGRGGFGAVYEARNDDGTYAVKVMLSRVAVDRRSRELFLREIATGRSLQHENLVPVLDFGSSGSLFYFVMPLGLGSLDDRLAERKEGLSIDEAVTPMLQALRGMAHAHERQFVHRDIKPANILLFGDRSAPVARVTDFGLAKNFAQSGYTGFAMTGPDEFAGTFAFMPPEQITNYRNVRPVSDVYSLGATLYNLLTGSCPRDFAGKDPINVVLDRGAVRPVAERLPSIPSSLAAVVDRSVAHDARDRYTTAGEFLEALTEATGGAVPMTEVT